MNFPEGVPCKHQLLFSTLFRCCLRIQMAKMSKVLRTRNKKKMFAPVSISIDRVPKQKKKRLLWAEAAAAKAAAKSFMIANRTSDGKAVDLLAEWIDHARRFDIQ